MGPASNANEAKATVVQAAQPIKPSRHVIKECRPCRDGNDCRFRRQGTCRFTHADERCNHGKLGRCVASRGPSTRILPCVLLRSERKCFSRNKRRSAGPEYDGVYAGVTTCASPALLDPSAASKPPLHRLIVTKVSGLTCPLALGTWPGTTRRFELALST